MVNPQRENDFITLTVLLLFLAALILVGLFLGTPANAGELGLRWEPVEGATGYTVTCVAGEAEFTKTTENREAVLVDLPDGCPVLTCSYTAHNTAGESGSSPALDTPVRPFLLGIPHFDGSKWILSGGNLMPDMRVQVALETAPGEFIDVAHAHSPTSPCEVVTVPVAGPEGPRAVAFKLWNVAGAHRVGEVTVDLPTVLPAPTEPVRPF